MSWVLLLLLAVSFGQRISRAEELPVKIGGGSGEEVEMVGVSGGILTVETRQPGDQMFVRQMSNGQDLLILIYTSNGQLVECEKFQGPTPELIQFLNQHLNRSSALQQDQNGTEFKDTEDVQFNQPPVDWIRSWKECSRLQEAEKEQVLGIRRNPARARRSSDWTMLFPGTNWCGIGQRTSNSSLYGFFEETDQCCHQHDHCPESIGPGEMKHDYFNFRFTTMNTCSCDNEFRSCLESVGENADRFIDKLASSLVGRLYFTTLAFNCYTLEPACIDHYKPARTRYRRCRIYSGVSVKIHEPDPY